MEANVDYVHQCNTFLGGLTSGSNDHTIKVIEAGFLKHFTVLLGASNLTVVKEICWILSNLAIGDEQQVGFLL